MNELRFKGLSIEGRIIVFFELAKDASLKSTYDERISAAHALITLLEDAEIDYERTATNLRREANRCGINDACIMNALENLKEGGVHNDVK